MWMNFSIHYIMLFLLYIFFFFYWVLTKFATNNCLQLKRSWECVREREREKKSGTLIALAKTYWMFVIHLIYFCAVAAAVQTNHLFEVLKISVCSFDRINRKIVIEYLYLEFGSLDSLCSIWLFHAFVFIARFHFACYLQHHNNDAQVMVSGEIRCHQRFQFG